jgi:hypothetical protein
MPPLYKVGDALPNGNTVVSDTQTTLDAQGTTQDTIIDSANNEIVITSYGAGGSTANAAIISANTAANLATIEAFIAANPSGASLDIPTTAALLALVSGSTRLATNNLSSVATTAVPSVAAGPLPSPADPKPATPIA